MENYTWIIYFVVIIAVFYFMLIRPEKKRKKQQQEMLNKKIAKMELERSRLTQSWNSERQMAKASNAYDANIMMEAELVKNITKGEKEWQQ